MTSRIAKWAGLALLVICALAPPTSASTKEWMWEAGKLGAHSTVTIDGTTRYTAALDPGLYEIHAEGEGVYLRPLLTNSGTVDSTNYYLPAGDVTYWTVESTPVASRKDVIGVVRSSTGTGTLHINRRDKDAD